MDIIRSAQNKKVKLARSLSEKKFRQSTGLMLLEGINLLRDLPTDVKISTVFATSARLDEAARIFSDRNAEILCVSDEVMGGIADTSAPYGIAAICEIPKNEFAKPLGNAILLDGVSDPGNVGTIVRSAAACGFEDLYFLDCADLYSPKVLRATLGAIFRVRTFVVGVEEARTLVKSENSAILDMNGENILKSDIPSPVLFVAGSEAHGVRDEFKNNAKFTYSIPMRNGIESLNVAVASSVAMYQSLRSQI